MPAIKAVFAHYTNAVQNDDYSLGFSSSERHYMSSQTKP